MHMMNILLEPFMMYYTSHDCQQQWCADGVHANKAHHVMHNLPMTYGAKWPGHASMHLEHPSSWEVMQTLNCLQSDMM
jgi:hypothetical protein